MTSSVPAKVERQQQIALLEERLKPASPDEVGEQLAILLAQFPSAASSDPHLRMQGYMFALNGICLDAIKHAVAAILKGETEVETFMPTAPQLSTICRRFQAYDERILKHARNISEQLDGKGYYLEKWMTAGAAESVGDVVARLTARQKEDRAADQPDEAARKTGQGAAA